MGPVLLLVGLGLIEGCWEKAYIFGFPPGDTQARLCS